MKAINVFAGVLCVAALGASGFFGYKSIDSMNQTNIAKKSLASLEQSIDMCKNQIAATEDKTSYYDTYLEMTAVAGIEISKIFVGSKDNVIEDASALGSITQGQEVHVRCKVINKAAIIEVMKIKGVVSTTQTDKSMEVTIKL